MTYIQFTKYLTNLHAL